jgi:hypothetical protein
MKSWWSSTKVSRPPLRALRKPAVDSDHWKFSFARTDHNLPDYWHKFWKLYANSFIAPLKSNDLLKQLAANPNVTGLYAEAWIRSFAKSMLPQFGISTSA